MKKTSKPNRAGMPHRQAGIFLFFFGAFAILIGLIIPIHIQMEPNIFCFALCAFAVPYLVYGVLYMILGTRVVRYIGEPQNFKSWHPVHWMPLATVGILMALMARH